MNDDQIKLLCDLKELQREMIKLAVKMMRHIEKSETQEHGRELNGAAAMIGDWIKGME
jgi:hypothetical protein